jgi:hypothetical protein
MWPGSALGGWDQVRSQLRGDLEGNAMLVVFSNCVDLIRTLPVIQHDKDNPEDMDTDGEDHGVDDVRYACLSRPWARARPQKTVANSLTRPITLGELVCATEAKRRNDYLDRAHLTTLTRIVERAGPWNHDRRREWLY